MPDASELFGQYASAYARGERPQAREYLAQAGPEADELAGLIERFLHAAPAPEPDEDARALAGAWLEGRSPLLELRTRRGLTRDEIVDALMAALGLPAARRGKVQRYYDELEAGQLEPRSVDRRVWSALAETLRARLEDVRSWRPRPARPEPTFFALEAMAAAPPRMAAMRAPTQAEDPDEVDRLFKGVIDPP